MDTAGHRYNKKRISNWDKVSQKRENPKNIGRDYNKLLRYYYKFLIPPTLRVLEIGCGHGHLLASLNPSRGVGIDFSTEMINKAMGNYPDLEWVQGDALEIYAEEKFDVIILSDLVNDLWDVQSVFEKLHNVSYPGTRIFLNFDNKIWKPLLSFVQKIGLGSKSLEQNWFAPHDIFNLLELSDFEVIHHEPRILLPLSVPYISNFANRYLVKFLPFSWFALTNFVCARPAPSYENNIDRPVPSVSVIVAVRNEAGHIEDIIKRIPKLGSDTEIIFVEGNSTDNSYEVIEKTIRHYPEKKCRLFKQPGKGKGDAVRLGFKEAKFDILMILDADMTVPPEDLPRFYRAIYSGKGEFINGVRLVYPMESKAMRFFNIVGNKFFSIAFSWLIGQKIKDTLCGTKVLWRNDYGNIAKNRKYFGEFDPFGDFDLLFGAAKLNLKIVEMPIRYRDRKYGDTNIDRWRHGLVLLKMVIFAAKKIKFI